jgi:hypothetical protein
MKFVRDLLAVVVLVLLVFILGMVAHVVYQVGPKLDGLVTDADRTIVIAAGAATNVEKASRAWESASKDQASATLTAMQSVTAVAKQVSVFISKTDDSINSRFVPALQTSLEQQNASLLANQSQFSSEMKDMEAATQQLQKTLADADAVIADPAMKETLANAATSSQNLASATADAAGTMKDVRIAVDHEVKVLLAPANKVKVVVMLILQAAGKFLGY